MTVTRIATLILLFAGLAAGAEVQIAYVGPSLNSSPAGRGALQGLEEAKLQGRFLGLQYELVVADVQDLAKLRGSDAIVVAGPPSRVQAVAGIVSEQGVPVFNVAATQDWLRTQCRPHLLHTIPSDAMAAAAVEQWRRNSEAQTVAAQAWHRDFVKFAARDLNKRFLASWGAPMNDEAWAAWAAVRIVADAVANNPEASVAERRDYIRSEMEFDGQKGAYMTFRETGQLRQPMLIVENGELAGEAPVRGVAASDDLDSLASLSCETGAP